MRLTCPNCSAQYEVPDEVIPEEGRDVQCSNCEKTWFQVKYPFEPEAQSAEQDTETAQPEQTAAQPEPAPEPQPRPEEKPEPAPRESSAPGGIDPAVANILKEEAAREADLRAQEGGGLETQPDLALDVPADPAPKPAIKEHTASETSADAGQRDALPDVDAINSSLRSNGTSEQAEPVQPLPRKSGGGFLRGFALIVILGIVLLLIYSNAQQISQAMPQADPILKPYVSLVDQARLWLETQAAGASQN